MWKPNGRTPRAISLTRVSSDYKGESKSHKSQHEENLKCIKRLGATLYKHYEETESGALYLSREKTQQALEDLEADRADYLVLYDVTRYGRSMRWAQEMLARIEACGKRLQFATIPLEYDEEENQLTPGARTALNSLQTVSEMERYFIRARFKMRIGRDLENNIMPYRSRQPFGAHIVTTTDIIKELYPPEMKGKYIINEQERPVVEDLFNTFLTEKSITRMQRYMRLKYPPEIYKRKWSANAIKCMLENPFYKGQPASGKNKRRVDETRSHRGLKKVYYEPQPEDKWAMLSCEPIISEELWQKCNDILKESRERNGGKDQKRHLLSGLLECPACGKKLRSQASRPNGKRNVAYYYCRGRKRDEWGNQKCTIKGLYLQFHIVEPIILSVANKIIDNPAILKASQAKPSYKVQQASGEKNIALRIKDAEKELARLRAKEVAIAEQIIEMRMSGGNTDPFDLVYENTQGSKKHFEGLLQRLEYEYRAHKAGPQLEIKPDAAKILNSPDVPRHEKNHELSLIFSRIVPKSKTEYDILLKTQGPVEFWLTCTETDIETRVEFIHQQ